MKPCENAIVTLVFDGKEERTLDMEAPTFMPICELETKIEESLRSMSPGSLPMGYGIVLVHNGKTLQGNSCLASSGIWEGSKLYCKIRQEG